MGFFSWVTADTNVSISNRYSDKGAFPVYVLIPEEFGGGYIKEENYEGFGIFGGQDIYELIARWNFPQKCRGKSKEDIRSIGINSACTDRLSKRLKYRIKITESPDSYENAGASRVCQFQGFFY